MTSSCRGAVSGTLGWDQEGIPEGTDGAGESTSPRRDLGLDPARRLGKGGIRSRARTRINQILLLRHGAVQIWNASLQFHLPWDQRCHISSGQPGIFEQSQGLGCPSDETRFVSRGR